MQHYNYDGGKYHVNAKIIITSSIIYNILFGGILGHFRFRIVDGLN